jgi:hypothetical protein
MLFISAFLLLFLSLPHANAWREIIPTTSTIPLERYGHTAVLWEPSRMIVFGGRRSGFNQYDITINETSECFAIGTCGELDGLGACVGCNTTEGCHCECLEGYSGVGCADQSVEIWLNDVSVFDLSTNTWTIYNSNLDDEDDESPLAWPSIRYAHTAVMIDRIMIIYGGYSQLCQDYCDDTWEYDTRILDAQGRGVWTRISPLGGAGPGKRWRHTAVAYEGSMYLFGGHRFNEYFNDSQYNFLLLL